jgi:hypothetical protein
MTVAMLWSSDSKASSQEAFLTPVRGRVVVRR